MIDRLEPADLFHCEDQLRRGREGVVPQVHRAGARMGVFAGNFDGQPGRGSDRLDDADRRSAAFERRSLFDVQLGKTEGLPQAAAARLDVIGVEALLAQRVVKRNTAGVDAFPEFIRPDPAGQQLAADGGIVEAG